jgi:hypothetical protein
MSTGVVRVECLGAPASLLPSRRARGPYSQAEGIAQHVLRTGASAVCYAVSMAPYGYEESGMQCPQCQHANTAEAKFCDQCGTRLVPRCPSCGCENATEARFCNQCGTRLTGHETATHAAPLVTLPTTPSTPEPLSYTPRYLAEKILTSRRALEGERKQVTVLFADIKDSTELIKDLDPEARGGAAPPRSRHSYHDGRRTPL